MLVAGEVPGVPEESSVTLVHKGLLCAANAIQLKVLSLTILRQLPLKVTYCQKEPRWKVR